MKHQAGIAMMIMLLFFFLLINTEQPVLQPTSRHFRSSFFLILWLENKSLHSRQG